MSKKDTLNRMLLWLYATCDLATLLDRAPTNGSDALGNFGLVHAQICSRRGHQPSVCALQYYCSKWAHIRGRLPSPR